MECVNKKNTETGYVSSMSVPQSELYNPSRTSDAYAASSTDNTCRIYGGIMPLRFGAGSSTDKFCFSLELKKNIDSAEPDSQITFMSGLRGSKGYDRTTNQRLIMGSKSVGHTKIHVHTQQNKHGTHRKDKSLGPSAIRIVCWGTLVILCRSQIQSRNIPVN
ncbi:hypothetical protein CBL_08164 [Carabus blaptoides fortunei]